MICLEIQASSLVIDSESVDFSESILIELLDEKMALQNRQPKRLIHDKVADAELLQTPLVKTELYKNIHTLAVKAKRNLRMIANNVGWWKERSPH